jgi:large repetitive protein
VQYAQAVASHVIGAEITYKCTATPGIFEVTLILYRDCFGVTLCPNNTCNAACSTATNGPIPNIILESAQSGCGFSPIPVTLTLVNLRDVDRNIHCTNSKNGCTNRGCVTPGSFAPSTEQYEFKGHVNLGPTSGLPANCCNVRLSWTTCCRSPTNNIQPSNFYTDAVINRCQSLSPCNSSPIFTNDPRITMCGDENIIYNNGAFDPDGDSLTYSFAPALSAFNSSVTYNAPFTAQQPMPWTGNAEGNFPAGIRCVPTTGDIMFTPTNSSQDWWGVLVVEVKQWKNINGVPTIIGTTRRDILIAVLGSNKCLPNTAPTIRTLPFDTSFRWPKTYWSACEGSPLCFTILAKDTDLFDTTYISWDSTLTSMGATITRNYNNATRNTNGPREDSVTFCWTPAIGTSRPQPYNFSVKAADNRCPRVGRVTRGFRIKVNSPSANINIQRQNLGCNRYLLQLINPTGTTIASSKWQIAKSPNDFSFSQGVDSFINITQLPTLTFNQAGSYLVKLSVSTGCSQTILYDTIVNNGLSLAVNALKDTIFCQGSSLVLNGTPINGTPPFTFRWFNNLSDTGLIPLNAPPFTTSNFSVAPSQARKYFLQIRDSAGCRGYDSVNVLLGKGLQNTQITNVLCFGNSTGSIWVNMQDSLMPNVFRLNNGPGQVSRLFPNLPAGTYQVLVTDTFGCSTQVNNLQVTQPDLLRDTFTSATNQTCFSSNNGTFSTWAVGGTSPYQYSLDSGTFSTTRSFSLLAPKTYTIYIRDASNCARSVTRSVLPADTLFANIRIVNQACFGNNNGRIVVTGNRGRKPYTYRVATTGSGSFVADTLFANLAPANYFVQVRDSLGCILSNTRTITQSPQINAVLDANNATCFSKNDGRIVANVSQGNAPFGFSLDSIAFRSTSQFDSLSPKTYKVHIRDSGNCVKTFNTAITQPAQIMATVAATNATCFGRNDGRIQVTVNQARSPVSFSLDSVTYQSANVFNQLPANTYKVHVKDSATCVRTFAATLAQPAKIAAGSITGTTNVIVGDSQSYAITPQTGLKYIWAQRNGTMLSRIDSSVITTRWDTAGAGMVYVAVYSDTTCGDTASLVINIGPNSLNEIAKQWGLAMHPNPTRDVVNINVKQLPENASIRITDIHGRILLSVPLQYQQQIDMNPWPQGTYFINIGEWNGKLMKW